MPKGITQGFIYY